MKSFIFNIPVDCLAVASLLLLRQSVRFVRFVYCPMKRCLRSTMIQRRLNSKEAIRSTLTNKKVERMASLEFDQQI